jgi:hypothetical protein
MVLDDLARLPDLVRTGLTTNPESTRRLRSDKYRAMREKT